MNLGFEKEDVVHIELAEETQEASCIENVLFGPVEAAGNDVDDVLNP